MSCGTIQPVDVGGSGVIGHALCCPGLYAPLHEPDAPTFNQAGVDYFLFEEFRSQRREIGGDGPNPVPGDVDNPPDTNPPGDPPPGTPGGNVPDFPWNPPGGVTPGGGSDGGGVVDAPGGQTPGGGPGGGIGSGID